MTTGRINQIPVGQGTRGCRSESSSRRTPRKQSGEQQVPPQVHSPKAQFPRATTLPNQSCSTKVPKKASELPRSTHASAAPLLTKLRALAMASLVGPHVLLLALSSIESSQHALLTPRRSGPASVNTGGQMASCDHSCNHATQGSGSLEGTSLQIGPKNSIRTQGVVIQSHPNCPRAP